ncbi:immune inhibitor A domain-containing protein [Allocatelliglobosispora scoriae]|uniref:immune inhibitor A domain-containing protein n=1 Tax=Allocatelliglobosispora scoriae TaxID=643052 RepID=UPI001622C7E7|nr:immune inhibitor A domain-containing protein [Allocatelliglobosispora scoriae]
MGLLTVSLATGMGLTLSPVAFAAPSVQADPSSPAPADDDLPNPLEAKRRELREQALSEVLTGQISTEKRGASTVAKVGQTNGASVSGGRGIGGLFGGKRNQYVELARETTDRVFVILAEFGNDRHPSYPDQDTDPTTQGPATFQGPLHNAIPAPDRTVDNSTKWQSDFTPDYFRNVYFGAGTNTESLKTYYETQSSGRYSVSGTVTDWVKVKYNEARYGRSNGFPCGGNVCNNTWVLVKDAANQWVADQKAMGRTDAQIAAELATFDKWDRYDFDGDGNFNEPDGYLDHFQIVHSGGDQADGDPQQGEDAIWSHRWYAYVSNAGLDGPAYNPLGGTQVGTTGLWIGDYTIQPENGGRSVFFHEYGHDLGLPDDYNVSSGGDNNNEHWTLMAQSRLGAAGEQWIGDRAGDLGAWNKLQLGWLNYKNVKAGDVKLLELGPQEYNTAKPQALVVTLPKKQVTSDLGAPFAGSKQYFSGNADDLNTTQTRSFDLTGKSSAALSLKGRYGIEEGFDYLYFEASTDGTNWTALNGTVGGAPFSADGGGRPAIEGNTGGAWVDINVPLTAYAGAPVQVRLHYVTDGGVFEGGFFGDNISVTANGAEIFADGAETATTWALDGFSVVGSTSTQEFDHFYIAGGRTYTSYDKYLKTGPYYFGYNPTFPDKVDHYSYDEGLLISYWDTSYADNDTFVHPGNGRNLIIDSHPKPLVRSDGVIWRARVQVYDAPFGLNKTGKVQIHQAGVLETIKSQAGNPLFDDTKTYWYPELPNHGVKVANAGVQIAVLWTSGTSTWVAVF